jgi:hypothetical protein
MEYEVASSNEKKEDWSSVVTWCAVKCLMNALHSILRMEMVMVTVRWNGR